MQSVSFVTLSAFPYRLAPDEEVAAAGGMVPDKYRGQIPKHVQSLNGRMVRLEGYLLPIKLKDQQGRTQAILYRDQSACCFGSVPEIHEWVFVTLTRPLPSSWDHRLQTAVEGVLQVGEQVEDGAILSVYRMDEATLPN